MPTKSRRRAPRLPVVVFALTTFLLMPLALLGQRTYVASDMKLLGSPARDTEVVREPVNGVQNDVQEFQGWVASFWRDLRQGSYQMWSPYNSGGVPTGSTSVFGTQSPSNLPYLVFPPWYAATLRAAAHVLVAQIGAYLFARRLGQSVRAATVVGVAYGFCGANLIFIHRIGAAAVAPLVLWAALRAAQRPTLRSAIALGGSLAWSWHEGFPAAFVFNLYAGMAVFLWISARLAARERAAAPTILARRATVLAGAMALTVGLSAITLISTVQQVRDRGYLELEGRQYDRHARLAETALFGMVDTRANGDWRGQLFNIINSYEGLNPVGSIALVGCAVALFQVARGRLRLTPVLDDLWPLLTGAVALLFTLYYFGTPLLDLVYQVPGLANNLFTRSRYLLALFIAVLAGAALDARLQKGGGETRAPSRLARAVSGVALLYVAVQVLRFLPDFVDQVRAANQRTAVAQAALSALAFGAVAVILAVPRPNRYAGLRSFALSMVVFAQLGLPLREYNPQAPVELFNPTTSLHEIVDERAGDRYRFLAPGLFTLYANDGMLQRRFDTRGQALQDPDYMDLVAKAAPAVVRDPWHILAYRGEYDYASPVLDHLAVRLVVLSTNDIPFGDETAPVQWADSMAAPGPIAGVYLTPLLERPCARGFVDVRLEDGDGRLIDHARRPIADAGGGPITFALTGTSRRAGEPVRLRAEGPAGCAVGFAPELRWIVEPTGSPLRIVDTDRGWVYERSTALELVSAHTRWDPRPTKPDARAALSRTGLVTAVTDRAPPAAPGSARVESYSIGTNSARASVTSDGPALVLFSFNDDKGWRAEVEGRPAPIVAVDGALIGVFVDAGTSEITLRYAPRAFFTGALVTAVTAIALIGVLVADRRRRSRLLVRNASYTAVDREGLAVDKS